MPSPNEAVKLERSSVHRNLKSNRADSINHSVQSQRVAIKDNNARELFEEGARNKSTDSIRRKRQIIRMKYDALVSETSEQPEDLKLSSPFQYEIGTPKVSNGERILKIRKGQEEEEAPKVTLQIQKIFADVGVSFQKYLTPDIFHDKHDGNANALQIDLLTADGNNLFQTSWIKFDQSNLKVYGFPLRGNQNEHTFILRATNSKGRSSVQKLRVIVYALEPVLNHYVHVCTTMTLAEYGGSVELRMRLAKAFANYALTGVRSNDVWIWKFEEGCAFVTFRHLPRKGKCNHQAIQTIEDRVLKDGEVNSAFQQALKGITNIVSVNVTVLNECRKSNVTDADDGLGWLRDIAPIFILIAVVAVPTLISCIVCREVRRRQAAMRQLQDRRMKEDREQMLLQAAEYKHECGFDSESEDGEGHRNKPGPIQEEEGKKFFGFSRIADIILPEVVIDTVKQGTEILNTFLPQDTREAVAKETKAIVSRHLPENQSLLSMNKSIENPEKEAAKAKSQGKLDSQITARVKSAFKFLKNPLDIASFEAKTELYSNKDQMKLSRIPAESLLPSISSIFGLEPNGGRQGSINNVKDTLSASIKKKCDLMKNTATFRKYIGNNDFRSCVEETTYKQQEDRATKATADDKTCRGQDLQIIQRGGHKHVSDTNMHRSGLVSCLGAKMRACDPIEPADNDASMGSKGAETSEDKTYAKHIGIFNRILHHSKAFVGSRKKPSDHDGSDSLDIELKEEREGERLRNADKENRVNEHCQNTLRREPIKQCKHRQRMSATANLEANCGTECPKNPMWDCSYDCYDNPFRHHYISPLNHNAENIQTEFQHEFVQESQILQDAVSDNALLANTGRCYVNMGDVQLEKERPLIVAADVCCRELEHRAGRRNSKRKQILESSLPSWNEWSDNCREYRLSSRGGLNDGKPRGLRHYDPASGNWYPAYTYTSLKRIVPKCNMFSLIDSFKRSDQEHLGQERSIENDALCPASLQWYNLNTTVQETETRKEADRNRRKTGMAISSHLMFERFPVADQYSQYGYSAEASLENSTPSVECKREPKGIWTENMYKYEDEDDENESFESSDAESDLQDLIFQIQDNRIQQYRYCPDELDRNDYYCEEDINGSNYRDEDFNYTNDLCSNFENELQHNADFNESHLEEPANSCEANRPRGDQSRLAEAMLWSYSTDFSRKEARAADDQSKIDRENQGYESDKSVEQNEFELCSRHMENEGHGRRRSLTDGQLQLSSAHLETVESPTKSEPGCSGKSKNGATKQRERRKSFLERQRRVEIPEKTTACDSQPDPPQIHVNPIFVIEERSSKDETDERAAIEDRFDFATVKRMHSANESTPHSSVRMRKLTYHGPFPTAVTEAEKIRKQDADIIEHQTKNFFERRRQSLQHVAGTYQPGKANAPESDPVAIQSRVKREDVQKRTSMRRFSTPSMESWTSTPEKYYYDATGDNNISEEDVNCAGLRKDKEKKKPFTSGRGRAKEYTQRLLLGVSPKIRRHSTSILGQKCSATQSGNATTNSGTFLGKIGEGKFVQTIQTKLGKKDSKAEEPKSPISKEKEKYMEEEKQTKGSPLTAIRNTLFLFSGGK